MPYSTLSNEISTSTFGGNILYVGGTGSGNYSIIQDAIDAASDGDTVFVYSGVYKENINIHKSIRLIGENQSSTKIDGEYKSSTVNINESGVTVSGFTIESGYFWGMEVKSDNNIISKNYISCSMWLWGDIDYGGLYVCKGSNNVISSNILDGDYIGWPTGLFIRTSANNTIINNVVKGNDEGIRLIDTSGNMINNNTIINANSVHHFGDGIYFYRAVNNIITDNCGFDNFRVVSSSDNFIINNTGPRIVLENSLNITIQDNTGIIEIHGGNLEAWNTHTIEGNYCYGRPIYYYKNNLEGDVVPANAGQIILANCQNITIQNLTMEGGNIQLGYCHYCEISGNYLNNIEEIYDPYGIYLFSSSFINITNNKINSYVDGINFLYSQKNTITNNSINNSVFGIRLYRASSNNIIIGNIITNNNGGIFLYISNSNRISENIISSNYNYGIYIASSHNIFDRNTISINYYGIYSRGSNNCSNNSILYNNINNNDYGINIKNYGKNNIYLNNIYLNSIISNDCGVYLDETRDNLFSSNNFIDNDKDVYFRDSDTMWEGNYWDHVWGNTKILFGTKQIGKIIFIPIIIPLINFDWHPAKEPYDIP